MALIDSSVGGLFGSPRLPAGRTRAAATTDDSALVFRCPACGKSLHSKEALRYHTNPNTTACDARFSPEERWRRRSQNRAIGARNRRDNAAFGRNKFGVSTPGARATAAAQRPINELFARLGGAATAAPAATGVGNTGDGAAAADSTGEGTATAADEDRALGEDRTAEEHEDDTQPPRRRQQYSLSMVQFADAVKESIGYFGYRTGVLVRVVKVVVFVRRPCSFTSPVAFGGSSQTHRVDMTDFWFTPPNPTMVDVSDATNFEVVPCVVWIPNVLWNRFVSYMPCPSCGPVGSAVTQDGWAPPRFVISLNVNSPVLASREKYICNICRRAGRRCRFRGYNPDAVAHLPNWIQWQMPAYVGPKTAIDRTLLFLLQRQPVCGQSFRDFANMVKELNYKYYYLMCGVYYGFGIADRLTPTVAGAAWYAQPENGKIVAFSEFDDAERYMGKVVGVQFLIRHFLRHAFSRWNFCRRAMQHIGGKYLRGDHSFKLVKKMAVDGERPFVAVYCVMNEYSEIVGYWFVRTKSQHELRAALKAIERRYRQFGYRRIELWFTDDVDAEFGSLTSIFPSLKTEWKPRLVLCCVILFLVSVLIVRDIALNSISAQRTITSRGPLSSHLRRSR